MKPGDEVLFPVWSESTEKWFEISGRILGINQNGMVRVRSSSGLFTLDVHPHDVTVINGGSDLNRTVASA